MVENYQSNEIYEFEIEDMDQNIDQLDGNLYSNFLTKYDYHYAKVSNYDMADNFEQGSLNHSSTPNFCQDVPQISYGFISRIK